MLQFLNLPEDLITFKNSTSRSIRRNKLQSRSLRLILKASLGIHHRRHFTRGFVPVAEKVGYEHNRKIVRRDTDRG